MLKITGADGQLRAIVFGYACHATVLQERTWSGDWPGFAQLEMEHRHAGAMALYWAGCGADQNPLPRKTIEIAQTYGRQMADSVDTVLGQPMQNIAPRLETVYEEIDLPFAQLPSREELNRAGGRNRLCVLGGRNCSWPTGIAWANCRRRIPIPCKSGDWEAIWSGSSWVAKS